MREKKVEISIVIPNWNGGDLLTKNLPHVVAHSGGAEIIVVDDASTDNSLATVRNQFPSVEVIAKNKHEGFASTVNVGVAAAHGDIVVLLNTDVVPEKDFLTPLIEHFADQSVFAVGCMDKSMEKGKVVLRGRGQAGWKNGFYIHSRGEVDKKDTAWVSGGSGAFRKTLWEKLGGMDPLYNPFYWEDIDLSYRACKAGYRLVFEPKSIVKHFHQEGKIQRDFSPQQIKQITYRNQFIFIWKNLSDPNILFAHAFWTPVRLLRGLASGDFAILIGYLKALYLLPKIIIARQKSSRFWKKADRDLV